MIQYGNPLFKCSARLIIEENFGLLQNDIHVLSVGC